jgi:hypothetical protein
MESHVHASFTDTPTGTEFFMEASSLCNRTRTKITRSQLERNIAEIQKLRYCDNLTPRECGSTFMYAFEDRKSINLQSREADAQYLKPDAIEP